MTLDKMTLALFENEPTDFHAELKKALSKYVGQPATEETALKIKGEVMYALNFNSLKKHEVLATVFDNKALKFDFGPDVPDEVKKSALAWAKKRGLDVVEASLNKSDGAYNHVILGRSLDSSVPVKFFKLT